MLSPRNVLGVPSAKIPIDGTTFVLYVLPPLVCYFAVAVLAVTPHMRPVRIALWPFVALLASRAVLSVDMSLGKPERKFLDVALVLFMLVVAVRTLDWTLAKGPLVRHLRPANSSPSTIMDALDLTSNFRGHGWELSRLKRSYIPCETRPTNRVAFAFCTFISAVAHALICGALHRAILTLAPVRIGPILERSTIFDDTLPFPLRYLRATIISTLSALTTYAFVQMVYDLCTIPAILVLGHDPVQWPPPFDAPWRATSLRNFWGRRWHQFFRHIFVLGVYPLSFVLGGASLAIGPFLASASLHHIALMALNSRLEIWWMFVGFGMMGPGILAEWVFQRWTGRRVGGVVGWVWTMMWLALWGNLLIEGAARAGVFVSTRPVDSALPVRISVEHSMKDFDEWLHTLLPM